jgi:hypothetical protein
VGLYPLLAVASLRLSREVAALPAEPVFAVSHGQPLSFGATKFQLPGVVGTAPAMGQIIGAGSTLMGNARPR